MLLLVKRISLLDTKYQEKIENLYTIFVKLLRVLVDSKNLNLYLGPAF